MELDVENLYIFVNVLKISLLKIRIMVKDTANGTKNY